MLAIIDASSAAARNALPSAEEQYEQDECARSKERSAPPGAEAHRGRIVEHECEEQICAQIPAGSLCHDSSVKRTTVCYTTIPETAQCAVSGIY
jgi:hypothetical protein